jgi:hypothetical protein
MKRRDRHLIKITQPFTIDVRPSKDNIGAWIAEIKTPELEHPLLTCADTPEVAVFMAWDVLRMVTGRCGVKRAEHDYRIDTTIGLDFTPAWGCTYCDVRTAKTEFVEE